MFHSLIWFGLCCLTVSGVEVKSVTEGDSVTLQTDITKIRRDDDILWKYGAENSKIAEISRVAGIFSTFDGPDGRFRDRLKLDNQTGSLTITNITTEHAGEYQLEIDGAKRTSKTLTVYVYARLPVPVIIRNSSECPSSCSVVCSVVNVSHVTLSWLKGNSLLSSISVSDLSISLSLPLEVEYQDNNTYSCQINNTITHQTTHLDISGLCQPCGGQGLPLFHIILISAAGSLVIIVVICCICKKCRQKDTSAIIALQMEERTETDSPLCIPKARKLKSKKEAVYENVPKRR